MVILNALYKLSAKNSRNNWVLRNIFKVSSALGKSFCINAGSEKDIKLVRVPGAYELPLAAKKLAASKVDAVVALGAVVRGATPHADLINETTARAFSEISLAAGVPVVDGVVSADNLEQAVERCGTKQGNKGFSAMFAAVEMADVLKRI